MPVQSTLLGALEGQPGPGEPPRGEQHPKQNGELRLRAQSWGRQPGAGFARARLCVRAAGGAWARGWARRRLPARVGAGCEGASESLKAWDKENCKFLQCFSLIGKSTEISSIIFVYNILLNDHLVKLKFFHSEEQNQASETCVLPSRCGSLYLS